MANKNGIQKLLVVIGPDLSNPEALASSTLLERAVSLANATRCELELFNVCFDSALESNLFIREPDLKRMREDHIEGSATRLAEMAAWLGKEGVSVSHETRWDSPRGDAILRKIADARPDLVMKDSREHGYVMGLTTNVDWELARRSPAHLWLVNDKVETMDNIVAAVGHEAADSADIATSDDYNLMRIAQLVTASMGARLHAANAYQIPGTQGLVAARAGVAATLAPTAKQQKLRDEIFARHERTLQEIARRFNIPKDRLLIREGRPNDVIPEIAESISADMLVMGATSMSRLERLLTAVTVEPVMSKVDCDILIVRELDSCRVPDSKDEPTVGEPKYALDQAITDPSGTFETPEEVANLSDLSFELRERILQAWEHDIRSEMVAENEGGAAEDIDPEVLDGITSAREFLEIQKANSPV